MPPRLVALVMLATYASLRWGELAALRRVDLDLDAATVRVERTQVEVGGRVTEGPTKSRAGRRVVAFPPARVPLLRLALPVDVWEKDVLPRRTGAYSPGWLDQLCTAGEVVWIGAGPPG